MKLKDFTKEELEQMSYPKIAAMYIKENQKPMNTAELFQEICDLLGLTTKEYEDKIGDFFESLTTNKDFILLDSGLWDLRSNHKVKINIDEIYDDEEPETEPENEEDLEAEPGEDTYENTIDDENYIDDDDDELSELTVVDEDSLDEEL